MAYVGSWERDRTDTALGGVWRGIADALESCAIPGCGRPVGATGGTCEDCSRAYSGAFAGTSAAVRAECWLCGAAVLGTGAACPDCVPVIGRHRTPAVRATFASVGALAPARPA